MHRRTHRRRARRTPPAACLAGVPALQRFGGGDRSRRRAARLMRPTGTRPYSTARSTFARSSPTPPPTRSASAPCRGDRGQHAPERGAHLAAGSGGGDPWNRGRRRCDRVRPAPVSQASRSRSPRPAAGGSRDHVRHGQLAGLPRHAQHYYARRRRWPVPPAGRRHRRGDQLHAAALRPRNELSTTPSRWSRSAARPPTARLPRSLSLSATVSYARLFCASRWRSSTGRGRAVPSRRSARLDDHLALRACVVRHDPGE